MSEIPMLFNRVRNRWQQVRMLRALARGLSLMMILIAALIALDVIYHFTQRPRLILLSGAIGVLVAALMRMALKARRPLSDAQAALLVEARFPSLQGLAMAAAEFSQQEPRDEEAGMLHGALLNEAAEQLTLLDLPAAVDSRPLLRTATATGTILATGALLMALSPPEAGHEFARTLMPWTVVPPTAAELAAQRHAEEIEAKARALEAAAQRAAAEAAAPAVFKVTPGACEVMRGGNIRVTASVSRVDGPLMLRLKLSDGSWRVLPMTPSIEDSKQSWIDVQDLADDADYCIAMGTSSSATYQISVFDQVEVTDLHVDYHAPAYARMPVRTVKGGDIEELMGSTAHLSITASGNLGEVHLVQDDGTSIPVTVKDAHGEADIPVTKDGGFHMSAVDAHGRHPVTGLSAHYAIHALPDLPPTIAIVYPAIDTAVHPLENIAIAVNVEDDVGLKEVRLCSTYGLADEQIEKRSCLTKGMPMKELLAQFSIDLKQKTVQNGDTILFHVEVEDLKGQSATTDPYVLTVRGYETMSAYANGNHGAGANGQNGAAYVTLLGALHDLQARRAQLTPEQYRAECDHIAYTYIFIPIAH